MESSLKKRKEEIRQELSTFDPEQVASRSGASLNNENLELMMLGTNYVVELPDYSIDFSEADIHEEFEVVLFDYILNTCNSSPSPSDNWIAFSEIPSGGFYSSNFKKNTEVKLTREFQNKRKSFSSAAEELGGSPISLGDEGYSFHILPKLKTAIVFWDGGDEFQDNVNVLFDESAADCLPTEGLSILGKMLCGQLLDLARGGEK